MFKYLNLKTIFPFLDKSKSKKILLYLSMLILFTVFSGALRKWVFGEGALGSALLLLQLFVPGLFYILMSRYAKASASAPIVWYIYIVYLIIVAFNPMNNTYFHGFLGVILHTGYFLIWLAYLQYGKHMALEKLIPLMMAIIIAEFILASLQYTLPGSHILNQYASGGESNATVGDAVRVSGTFSYIGGFQVFIPLIACTAWFMMLKKYNMSFIISTVGLGLIMAFMSGSRGAVGFYILHILMAFLLSGSIVNRLLKATLQAVVIIYLVGIFIPKLSDTFTKSYDNFMNRVENSDEIDGRLKGSFNEILDFKGKYPLFGVGLGSTYQGANALFGTSIYVKEYGGYESEPARIILEGGFVLFALRLVLLISFLIYTSNLPLPAKGFFFIIFFNIMVTFNIYQGVFFVLGIMFVDRGYYLKVRQPKEIKSI